MNFMRINKNNHIYLFQLVNGYGRVCVVINRAKSAVFYKKSTKIRGGMLCAGHVLV